MNLGPTSRLLASVASLFLLVTGAEEWSAQSKNSYSWQSETSFAALTLRSQGKLKVGLAIGFAALATAGIPLKKRHNITTADD